MSEDASALVTIGRATVSMTHDLNNLLFVIGGHAEAIQREKDAERHGIMAEKIESACLSASRMTRYILSLVLPEHDSLTLIDVAEHLRSIEGILSDLAGSSVELQLDVSGEPLMVSLRQSFLDQMLINLVVNSREANASLIKISARRTAFVDPKRAPQLQLEVQDNGEGFSESALKYASSEYFSEGKQHGIGVGLSTVKQLVQLSNGLQTLSNRQNLPGAVVQIQLPLQRTIHARSNSLGFARQHIDEICKN